MHRSLDDPTHHNLSPQTTADIVHMPADDQMAAFDALPPQIRDLYRRQPENLDACEYRALVEEFGRRTAFLMACEWLANRLRGVVRD